MKNSKIEIPEELKKVGKFPIPLDYFSIEIEKILTGYGYSKSTYTASLEISKKLGKPIMIGNAFEEYAKAWNAPIHVCGQHFGHTSYDGRCCDYDARIALRELVNGPKVPEEIKKAIIRRVFRIINESVSQLDSSGEVALDRDQIDLIFSLYHPYLKLLLLDVLAHLGENDFDIKNEKIGFIMRVIGAPIALDNNGYKQDSILKLVKKDFIQNSDPYFGKSYIYYSIIQKVKEIIEKSKRAKSKKIEIESFLSKEAMEIIEKDNSYIKWLEDGKWKMTVKNEGNKLIFNFKKIIFNPNKLGKIVK